MDHILASGSADHTALLWDMNTASVAARYTFVTQIMMRSVFLFQALTSIYFRLDCHKEKVQAVSWHPFDHHTLATGACDSFVR